jgi:pyruvate,water dikinase
MTSFGQKAAATMPTPSARRAAKLPDDLVAAITEGYRRLEAQYGAHCDVAVRSSATAEDP